MSECKKIHIVFRLLKEQTGISYRQMAKLAGIHRTHFDRYVKTEKIPEKQAEMLKQALGRNQLGRGRENGKYIINRSLQPTINPHKPVQEVPVPHVKGMTFAWEMADINRLGTEDLRFNNLSIMEGITYNDHQTELMKLATSLDERRTNT